MSWTSVGLIPTTEEWQYTEAFEGDYVRFRHLLGASQEDLPYGFTGLIAQAFDFANTVELFNIRKLYPYNEEDIFPVINPFPDRSRRLAIRGQTKYQTAINWRVAVDVWQGETAPVDRQVLSALTEIRDRLERLPAIEAKIDLLLANCNGNADTENIVADLYSAYFFNLL